ncbi:hypothetical protein [Acuticoccus sp. I52.16.1]|nr:hypothetical protein [Acuticoccus sp. I52.16.1]
MAKQPESGGNVRRISSAWLLTLGAAGAVVVVALLVISWFVG